MALNSSGLFSTAHAFNPKQLTLARELRGLLKHELAHKINKSPSAIGQFESGRARPEPQTISALSLALGIPHAFFSRQVRAPSISAEGCQFRSLRSSTVREQRYILARGELLKELVTLLEDDVDFPEVKIHHPIKRISAAEDIEACAMATREAMGIKDGPIGSVVNELENVGILVIPMDADCRRVDAFSTWIGSRPYVFLNGNKGSTSRTRYDAAHELGHLVMHADVVPGNPEFERQADQFAAAFLLPKCSFEKECSRRLSFEHLFELKQRWKVSVSAIIYRARDLGFFSDATASRAYMQMNIRGIRRDEPHEPVADTPNLLTSALDFTLGANGSQSEKSLAEGMCVSIQELRALVEGRELPAIVTQVLSS